MGHTPGTNILGEIVTVGVAIVCLSIQALVFGGWLLDKLRGRRDSR